jgi:hypothetical protein
MASRLARLTPAQYGLLVNHLPTADGNGGLREVARQCAGRRTYPLSFVQERLWRAERAEPGGAARIIVKGFRFGSSREPFDVDVIRGVVEAMAARHDILRTTFHETDSAPVQEVGSAPDVTFRCVDLRPLDEGEREAAAARIATAETGTPFDLGARPPWRIGVLRLTDHELILLAVFHHVLIDGWSLGLVFKEMAALYPALAEGRPSPLPELPVQYGHFALWQRQHAASGAVDRALAYWKSHLSPLPPPLDLPFDRARPSIRTSRGALESFTLEASLLQALTERGQAAGATLFMTLLAAFAVLLHRCTGQEDVAIGSSIAGRDHLETEDMIGCFLNTLVLRLDVSGDPTFGEFLARVRRTTLDAYAHGNLPFEKLLAEIAPAHDSSRSPLFQVHFVLQNAAAGSEAGVHRPAGMSTGDPVWAERFTARFDLSLGVREQDRGGSFEFNTDLFDTATIQGMIAGYQTLLEQVAAASDRRISDLSWSERADGAVRGGSSSADTGLPCAIAPRANRGY